MSELKPVTRIDFKKGRFNANGKEYIISEYVTVGRETRYVRASAQVGFGLDWKGVFKILNEIYTHATTGESPLAALHKIAVASMNAMDGMKGMANDDRVPAIYELCAMIINTPGEDPATISEATVREKYEDWSAEGIPREDFFELAIASMLNSENALKILREAIAKAESEEVQNPTT